MDYTKFKLKATDLENHYQDYYKCSQWCNENGYVPVLEEGYYIVKKIIVDQENKKYIEYKNFLQETDYVTNKITELLALEKLGIDISEDLKRYENIINERQTKRKFVSDYEDANNI